MAELMSGVLIFSLILVPLTGGVVCWMKALRYRSSCRIALGGMLWVLLGALVVLRSGLTRRTSAAGSLRCAGCDLPWIPHLGANVNLLVDELSAALVALTGLLGSIAVIHSWSRARHLGRIFHVGVLCTVGVIVGVLLSADLLLFSFFWELLPISLCLLIGSRRRETDIPFVRRFLIYSQISGLLMLFSTVGSAVLHHRRTGVWTFSCAELASTSTAPAVECLLTLAFLPALAVKLPLVPLHGWLAEIDSHTPVDGSMDLMILLLKIPAYGIIRLTSALHPRGLAHLSPITTGLGLFTLFYGSWVASAQDSLKKLLIYSHISHAGLILLTISGDDIMVRRRIVLQLVADGLSTAGMFIACAHLHRCTGTFNLGSMGDLRSRSRFISQVLIFLVAAALGMPGTVNFIGELGILLDAFRISPWVGSLAAFGPVFSSINHLKVIRCTHRSTPGSNPPPAELDHPDRLILLLIVLLITLLGILPDLLWM